MSAPRRRAFAAALASAACAALAACGPSSQLAPPPACEVVADPDPALSWGVQLHVHGSYSEGIGSIESHTAEAQSVGVRTIWWSDHDFQIATWHNAVRVELVDPKGDTKALSNPIVFVREAPANVAPVRLRTSTAPHE